MLVPYISVKSIAKILLMLMMPGGKAPDKISAPQLQYIQIPAHLMAQGPFVTQYNQGFLLQFQASAAAYLISPEQMNQIINSMTIAEKDAAFADPANISFNLAAHIIQQNHLPVELSESSSQAPSSSMHFSPSSQSPQGHSLHGYYEDMRPPTLFEATQDLFQKNSVSVRVSAASASRQNRFPNSMPGSIKGEMLTEPPGTIEQYKQQGNVQMLRLKRDSRLAKYNSWRSFFSLPVETTCDLSRAEEALIDLGHIEYPQLQKMRAIATRGGLAELQDRYKRVCALLLDRRTFISGIRRNEEGGKRMLRLEQHYLAQTVNNQLIKPLENITKAEGPEVRAMLAALYRKYYHGLCQADRAYYEWSAGFNVIEAAHALVMKQHPNGAQIIASVKQEFARETGTMPAPSVNTQSSSSSSSATNTTTPLSTANKTAPTSTVAPTTTAATGPGTTTTTTTINAQACATSDLPAIGAPDHVALDMVTTLPTQAQISQKVIELMHTMFQELSDAYSPDDPTFYAEAQEVMSTILQQESANYSSRDPMLYAVVLEKTLARIPAIEKQIRITTTAQHKEWVAKHANSDLIMDSYKDLCSVWHFSKGFGERIIDVEGLVKDNVNAYINIIKFCAQELLEFDFTKGRPRTDRTFDLNAPHNKVLQCFTPENIEKISQCLAKMSSEECSNAMGRMFADMVFTSLAHRGVAATMKATRNIANLHAEGKLAQSIEQVAQSFASKVKNITPAAEETIAVTAEGIAVKTPATGVAQETVSMHEANQPIRGAAKEAGNLLVSPAEQSVIKNLTDSLVATVRQDIPRLRQLFDGKTKGFKEFANKFLKFDYEHILGMEVDFARRGAPRIGGFHHDFMGTIEKSNVFEFANKTIDNLGFCKTRLFFKGGFIKEVSFFPAHWSREQVMSKIVEAYENALKQGIMYELGLNQKYKIIGMIQEGIEIEMHITQQGKVMSAFPILK